MLGRPIIVILLRNEYLEDTHLVFLNRFKLIETNLPGAQEAFSLDAVDMNKLLFKRYQLIQDLAPWEIPPWG
jgi:hypothetical protein